MGVAQDRRGFLRSSLAAGAALTLAGETQSGWGPTRSAMPAAGEFVNRRVRPGRVRWHDDFAAACRAAESSRKPVLHFQMMGRMDEKFC